MSPAWAERFVFAVRVLGLSPEAFWALSLAEWRALTASHQSAKPLARRDLDALLSRYPDLARSGDTNDS
jgi:uncharacterized phage protein (TIGR02216 family)